MVHGVVHGLGPWTGSMGWSMDQVHMVVHGPRSMFCIRPRFSARLRLANLMPGSEIENVVFLGNTEIFKERKQMAFLLLQSGLQIGKSRVSLIFQVLSHYI